MKPEERATRAGVGGLLAGGLAILACELPLFLGLLGAGAAAALDTFALAALCIGFGLLGWSVWRRLRRKRAEASARLRDPDTE